MKLAYPLAVILTSTLIGCGSSNGGSDTTDENVDPGPPKETVNTDDPCGLGSGYTGDYVCIPPPDPNEGIQIHVGPTNYDNPDEVAPYLLDAGQENVECFNAPIPQSDFYYLRQQNRMRPSSHHMLIFVENGTGLQPGLASGGCDLASSVGTIPGSQTPMRDFPDDLGPEDEGIARYLPQGTMAGFQMHYINTTDGPVLREAWVNLYKKDAAQVTQRLQSIFYVGDFLVNVPAMTQQTTTLVATPSLTSETRLFEVNAHIHAHTETFTLWRIRAGQTQEELMYQSFDWQEPLENTFNSVVTNPMPDPTTLQDGGLSGLQYLEPGDTLKWSCDVNNTTDQALTFKNEALTGEMCMLVGTYIGDTSGLLTGACYNGTCSNGLGF